MKRIRAPSPAFNARAVRVVDIRFVYGLGTTVSRSKSVSRTLATRKLNRDETIDEWIPRVDISTGFSISLDYSLDLLRHDVLLLREIRIFIISIFPGRRQRADRGLKENRITERAGVPSETSPPRASPPSPRVSTFDTLRVYRVVRELWTRLV